MNYLFIYLLLINMLTFIIFFIDKKRSQRDRWRIPEASLFLLCLIGGSLGGLISMYTFRHKTKKWTFKYGLPLMLALNIYTLYLLFAKLLTLINKILKYI